MLEHFYEVNFHARALLRSHRLLLWFGATPGNHGGGGQASELKSSVFISEHLYEVIGCSCGSDPLMEITDRLRFLLIFDFWEQGFPGEATTPFGRPPLVQC